MKNLLTIAMFAGITFFAAQSHATSSESLIKEAPMCGEVEWSCGATGIICAQSVQGLIDRYNEANPC